MSINSFNFRLLKIKNHPRIIKLKTAIKWTRKYPTIYKMLNFMLNNNYLKKIKIKWAPGDSMTVYAKKIKNL